MLHRVGADEVVLAELPTEREAETAVDRFLGAPCEAGGELAVRTDLLLTAFRFPTISRGE